MGSIQSNDSWEAERYLGDDLPNQDEWCVTVLGRIEWTDTGDSGSIRTLFEVNANDHYEFNIVQRPWEAENTGIRGGNFQGGEAGIIPVAADPPTWPADSVVPTAPGSTKWVRLVISCDGAVDPGTDWSGTIRYRWLVDGESEVYELSTRPAANCRLVTIYLMNHPNVKWSELRVYTTGITDEELVELNNSRTNPESLDEALAAHWPLASVATAAADISGNGYDLTVTGTGVDSTDEPAFSDDAEEPEAITGTGAAEVTPPTASGSGELPVDIGTPLSSAVVMWSGHSLQDEPIPSFFEDLATDAGVDVDWQRQYIVGSPISSRSKGTGDLPGDPPWNGYRRGNNRVDLFDEEQEPPLLLSLDLVSHFRSVAPDRGKETSDPYTALVLAERHGTYSTVWFEGTVRFARHYYELIREGSPSCVGYLYGTWLSIVGLATRTGPGPDVLVEHNTRTSALHVEIQTATTLRWSLDGGSTWEAQNVAIGDSATTLTGWGVIFTAGTFVPGTTYDFAWANEDYATWIQHAIEEQTAVACVASRINLSLAHEGRTDRLQAAPTALALARLMEAALSGSGLPGVTVFDGSSINFLATKDVLFVDAVHNTDTGKWFLANVCYSTVYRRDCRGLARPDGMSETTATSLQQVAWATVVEYFDGRPLGEQYTDLASLKAAFIAYLPLATLISGQGEYLDQLTDYFGGTESDLHFNAATDASVWFAAPEGASISGSGSATVDPPAASGSGVVGIGGTGAASVDPPTGSGSGEVGGGAVSGSGSAAVTPPAASGSGTVGIGGSGSASVTPPAGAGSGTVGDGETPVHRAVPAARRGSSLSTSEFEHDPAETLDYGFDWSRVLRNDEGDDDSIVSSVWFASGLGLTVGSNSHDERTTRVWVSGGTLGTRPRLTNRVTTAAGRTAEASVVLRIVDK